LTAQHKKSAEADKISRKAKEAPSEEANEKRYPRRGRNVEVPSSDASEAHDASSQDSDATLDAVDITDHVSNDDLSGDEDTDGIYKPESDSSSSECSVRIARSKAAILHDSESKIVLEGGLTEGITASMPDQSLTTHRLAMPLLAAGISVEAINRYVTGAGGADALICRRVFNEAHTQSSHSFLSSSNAYLFICIEFFFLFLFFLFFNAKPFDLFYSYLIRHTPKKVYLHVS